MKIAFTNLLRVIVLALLSLPEASSASNVNGSEREKQKQQQERYPHYAIRRRGGNPSTSMRGRRATEIKYFNGFNKNDDNVKNFAPGIPLSRIEKPRRRIVRRLSIDDTVYEECEYDGGTYYSGKGGKGYDDDYTSSGGKGGKGYDDDYTSSGGKGGKGYDDDDYIYGSGKGGGGKGYRRRDRRLGVGYDYGEYEADCDGYGKGGYGKGKIHGRTPRQPFRIVTEYACFQSFDMFLWPYPSMNPLVLCLLSFGT